MAFRKITTPSLKEVFIQEIENMILSGELKIGDKLPPERELIETMGISLSVVTSGIAELESKGFVEIRPRHGVFVADYIHKGSLETLVSIMRYNNGRLSQREVVSMIETRIANEQLMVRLAIEKGKDEDIKRLESYFDTLEKEKDLQKIAETVTDFFHELAILSDNVLLPLMYHAFRAPIIGIYIRYMEKNGTQSVCGSARELYDYVVKRDVDGAVKFVNKYLRRVIEGDKAIFSL